MTKRGRRVFVIQGGSLRYTWVYANEVTHGGPLESFRIGVGHYRKVNHVIRGLEIRAKWYQPNLQWGEENWRLSSVCGQWFNHCLCNECNVNKNSGHLELGWVSLLMIDTDVLGGWPVLRTQRVCVWGPPRSCPMCVLIWLVLISSFILKL